MHALVVSVSIAPGQFEQSQQALHSQVIPRVKQAPGVIHGYWTVSADHAHGNSVVVFDTKEHAEATAAMVRQQPTPAGVTFNSMEVREVVAHL